MQEQDYEEQQYEEDFGDYTRESGKNVYYLVGYFLLVAILVYPATRFHIGMTGILYAMAGAGVVLGLIWWCIRSIKRKMQAMHLSKGEWARFLWGYQTAPVVEADGHTLVDNMQEAPQETRRQASTDTYHGRSVARLPRQPYSEPIEEGELPDRILEPDGLYLSDSFMPAIGSLFAAVLLFCGIRRAGKSNGMGVVAEEVGHRGTPLLLCDTEDEYGPMANRQYLPRGFLAGSPDLLHINGRMHHYIPVDVQGAERFGWQLLEDNMQVVLNLKSYTTDDEAALVMAFIVKGMYAWEAGRPNGKRIPAFVFLDEANKWLPQSEAESCIKKKDVFRFLQLVFFSLLVRRGGKQGLGLALATQRISELDKRALQSTWKFLFLQTEQIDIDRYRAFGLEQDEIVTLQPGECFVFSPQVIGFKVYMRQRFSPHLGHTPGMAQLQEHHRRLRPVEQIAIHTFAGPENRQQCGSMPSQKLYQEPLTRDDADVPIPGLIPNTPRSQEQRQRLLSPVQQLVLQAWNAGYKSHRAIGAYLRTQWNEDVSDNAAYQALLELEALHLITGRQKKASTTTGAAEQG
jgi:hypothetical protein